LVLLISGGEGMTEILRGYKVRDCRG